MSCNIRAKLVTAEPFLSLVPLPAVCVLEPQLAAKRPPNVQRTPRPALTYHPPDWYSGVLLRPIEA